MTIEITQYTDYVPYLKEVVTQKRTAGTFSFRRFCQKSGFRSPTYLKWVLDEKRPISPKSAHKFAEGLGLGKKEAHYLQLLVHYKHAREPRTRSFFFQELLKWKEKRPWEAVVKDQYEYLSHWYYVTLRELAGLPDFQEDPQWIQKRLFGTVGAWEIRDALKTLERLGLVYRDEEGRLRQKATELHTGREVESVAAYHYHKGLFEISGEILNATSHEVREVFSLVSPLDPEIFRELKSKMNRFQDEVVVFLREAEKARASSETGKRQVYMMNMQLMPLTRFEDGDFSGGDHEDS